MFSLDITSNFHGPALACGLFALGLGLGMVTGIFGVGGAFIVVPVLNVVFGVDYSLAKGSSLACVFGTAASGLLKRLRLGNVAKRTMLIISGGSVFGAAFGGLLNDYSEHLVGGDEQLLKLIMHPLYILLLIAAAVLVIRSGDDDDSGPSPLQKLSLGPNIRIRAANMDNVSLVGLITVGLGVGILTGLMGVGGGVLMMPILLGIVGLPTTNAVGTSLGIVMFSSAAGVVKYVMVDSVNLTIAMAIMFGGMIGVQIGTVIGGKLGGGKLRKIFAMIVLAVAVMVIIDLTKNALSFMAARAAAQ